MASKVIAIYGGIGAGKSVISRMLRAMGYSVYDCDTEAKRLMDGSDAMKRRLSDIFGSGVVNDAGNINRQLLARIVFSDSNKLNQLNQLVHSEVASDLRRWMQERESTVFVETAILYQSGLDKLVDEVWEVVAPREIRVIRASRRDSRPREDIIQRVESQDSYVPEQLHKRVHQIINDGFTPLLPQVLALL